MNRNRKVLALSAQSLRNLAKRLPESLAIASEQEQITKIEFSEMVNAYAKLLSEIPKASSFLPVLVGTNIDSVIIYHAAILSRTPVALIDGNTNPAYLAKILGMIGSPEYVVVTSQEFSENLSPQLSQIHVGRERCTEFEIPKVDPEEAAIVIFSSGSTGESKGVVWSWKNLDDAFSVMTSYYPEGSHVRLGRVTSIAFAAGAYQMLSAAADHNLHLINPASSPDEIIDFVNKNELSQLSFSSSFAERVYDQKSRDKYIGNVIEVLTYGEALSWEQIKKIRELTLGNAEIRASYGASESPGFVVYFLIKPDTPIGIGRVPIGQLNLIENLELHPNPEDPTIKSAVVTNLVARGYLDSPKLTEEKFKVNARNERCYHTGDLVRVNDNGVITFVGRNDDLVKINGRLVGPGESESFLQVLPGISNVAVLPHLTSTGKNYLAAHLVLSPNSELVPAHIYEYLLKNLSSHLVPGRLVRHLELPLNSNGKIDRKALQNRQWERWTSDEKTLENSVIESFVLSQLRRILNTPDLTQTEDIFGSGMDSLAALEFQVMAEEFGYKNVQPTIFLEHRTVRSVAEFLAKGKPEHQSNFITLNKTGSLSPFFIFPGAGVSAIFFKELADFFGFDQPLVVIEPKGLHTSDPVEESLEQMALNAAHEIKMKVPKGNVYLIGHSAGAAIACEVGIILTSMGYTVSMVSLDASGIANGVSLPPKLYKAHSIYQRTKDIFTHSPQNIMESIQRRQKARSKNSYEFFTLHVGKLAMNYKPKRKPNFPILFLYCSGMKNEIFWKNSKLYKFNEIQGKHFTMLNREFLPGVTSKILSYFIGHKESDLTSKRA